MVTRFRRRSSPMECEATGSGSATRCSRLREQRSGAGSKPHHRRTQGATGQICMNEAHNAIGKWIAANWRESAGHSWEISGDPTPDPADTETTIVYLLT